MSKLLVTAPMAAPDLEKVSSFFDDTVYEPWDKRGIEFNESELKDCLMSVKPSALITERDPVSADVLAAYHDLDFIGDCRGTPVNVDSEAAAGYGIPVLYTPGRNAQAVSELLVASTIIYLRNAHKAAAWLREGKWTDGTFPYHDYMGNELKYKKVGIVGMGAVARATCRILDAFDCDISFYDPYVPEYNGYRKCSLEEIFSSNDIVSIHLPVTPQTRGMIGGDLLRLMQPHALLLNSSRSAVVNTADLKDLLRSGKIRGFVTDIFDHEPPDEDAMELIRMPNVLSTPHIYGATYEVAQWQSRIIASNVEKFIRNEDLSKIIYNYKSLAK